MQRPEQAWVDRLMSRDESALGEVVSAHGPTVYGLARRIVSDPNLAEEVAQDVFVALWRRPGAYDSTRGSLQSFLLGVTRNKAVDLVRREESSRRVATTLIAEAEATSKELPTTEHATDVEQRHEIRDALASLSPPQREAIVLAYFGGRTYREVAEELGIPEGTAKTRLRDGLIQLRQMSTFGGAQG
ncbi:MAG: sigma-70 family RNA polymerase sigma factor [Actinomycetota bacterium]|nr:sigma-70 family RNA polymerase sigma factor [Actinomycetota bacterium]